MPSPLAEIIAIGDELVSGQRLDTNTQWISQQLAELGIRVAFHSTVGDDIDQKLHVFRTATDRADLIVCTGGLGPTADDLTREVIAQIAGVALERKPEVVEHIREMYRHRSREMPDNNLCQADFPIGANVIPNPEGTAPGIDFSFDTNRDSHRCRVFALPGVPAELKQMWSLTVGAALRKMVGAPSVIHFRTLHVFGEGESKIETMLPDLVRRGNDPTVGITASAATITLRVSTAGESKQACEAKIEPVLQTIRDCLGDLVFGANGQTLADVVVDHLHGQGNSIALIDAGLFGHVAAELSEAAEPSNSTTPSVLAGASLTPTISDLAQAARDIRQQHSADFGVAIGAIDRNLDLVEAGESWFEVVIAGPDEALSSTERYCYRGHSAWRQARAVKQVLNQLRLLIGPK